MNGNLDPVAAQQALDVTRRQRGRVLQATREPWWVWVAAMALVFAIWAARDFFGPDTFTSVLLVSTVALVAVVWLPRVSPRFGAILGRQVQAHRTATPLRYRVAMTAVSLAGGVAAWLGGAYGADVLRRLGAPAWAVDHPHAAAGATVGAVLTAVAWAVDGAIRRGVDRRSR